MRLFWSAILILCALVGCARYPEDGGVTQPSRQLAVTVRFAAPIEDNYYYFVAFDTNQDELDGPVPVVQGPFWGNGWGTGPISHFVEYHQGQFSLNQPFVLLELTQTDGSIIDLEGEPENPQAGQHFLTVQSVTLGAASLTGAGNILDVSNDSDQNAGVFSIETDALGETVAGGVSFTPAAVGGRPLTAEEQAAIDLLNQGGVPLGADSLIAFGLTLEVRTLNFIAATQTIDVSPTTGEVSDIFRPDGGFTQVETSGEVIANARSDPVASPILGVALTSSELIENQQATIVAQMSPTATFLGPPYSVSPVIGDTLSFIIDIDALQSGVPSLEINFIATDKLIIDPNSTEEKIYDALGVPERNEFVTISTQESFVYTNSESMTPEEEGDCPIEALDIVDWSLEVRLF